MARNHERRIDYRFRLARLWVGRYHFWPEGISCAEKGGYPCFTGQSAWGLVRFVRLKLIENDYI